MGGQRKPRPADEALGVGFAGIDSVDALADLIKWLEYDVLKGDLGSPFGLVRRMDYNLLAPPPPANPTAYTRALFGPGGLLEGLAPVLASGGVVGAAAFLGACAALSSQAYKDGFHLAGFGRPGAGDVR